MLRTCRTVTRLPAPQATVVYGRLFSYYEAVNGLNRDKKALACAREAIAGQGDGVISKQDAQNIVECLVDGPGVTATEFSTAFVILRDFKFTPPAKQLFVDMMAVAKPS